MKRFVLIYQEMIPSVRLCIYEQLRFLEQQGRIHFEAVSLSQIKREQLAMADVVVMVRGSTKLERLLADQIKKSGKFLIYVLDDDLLHVPSYVSSADYYMRKDIQNNIRSLMDRADCLITPSVFLAEKYGHLFRHTLLVEEPALNCHQKLKAGNKIKIGFAGSVDRTMEVEKILLNPLQTIRKRFGEQIEIELFGVEKRVTEELKCKWIPYMNSYSCYQTQMDSLAWDIGLAPLEDTEFCACKHYNKFIEYGSHGTVCVASNLPPYNRIIRNGENGLLCDNTEEAWIRALSSLIEDAARRESLSNRVYAQMQKEFELAHISEELWKKLDPLVPEAVTHEIHGMWQCKGLDFSDRAMHGLARRLKRLVLQ